MTLRSGPRRSPPPVARWIYAWLIPEPYSTDITRNLDEVFRGWVAAGGWTSFTARGRYWSHVLSPDTVKLRILLRRRPASRQAARHQKENGMTTWLYDVRYAFRTLRKSPAHSLLVIVTLALGIGANAAIFSVVNNVLLQPLPYANGKNLVRVTQAAPGQGATQLNISPPELADYRARSTAVTDFVEYHTMFFNLLSRGEPERVQVGVVSWNFFEVLGVPPLHGRTFTAEEDHIGDEPVLVLGYEYWVRRFGADPDVVGTTVEMNNMVHTIVGVLPAIPTYPNQNAVWMPWYACPFRAANTWHENRNARGLTVLGLAHTGTTAETITADLERAATQMVADYPETYTADSEFTVNMTPLKEELTSNARSTFLVLAGIAGFVLLIACANVANLMLARLANREQEFAVRQALGADRGRITRQMVTESVMLAGTGGVLGVVLAFTLVDLLGTFAAGFTPRAGEVGIDLWVVGFTLGLAVLAGLLVGGLPAMFVGRSFDALRAGTHRLTGSIGTLRTRAALVVAQVGLAFMLLFGSGLMIRSFVALQRVDPGFVTDNVLAMTIDLDWVTYNTGAKSRSFFQQLLQRVQDRPQVIAAGVASDFPLSTGGFNNQNVLLLEGQPEPEPNTPAPQVSLRFVTDGYFEALRVALLSGRTFTRLDNFGESPRVVVISRSVADRYWEGRDPVGQRIRFNNPVNQSQDPWFTVIGVVGDVKQADLASDFTEEVYVPYGHAGFARRLLIRTAGDPTQLARAVTEDVYAIDSRQPVSFIQTLEEAQSAAVSTPRTLTLLMGVFAGLALMIAATGILGLIAYAVSQRTHEIGVRLALGAKVESIIGLVLRQALVLVAGGLAIGVVGSIFLGRALQSQLFETAPTDVGTLVVMGAVLLIAAAIAAYIPARRVIDVHPMQAFKSE